MGLKEGKKREEREGKGDGVWEGIDNRKGESGDLAEN